MLFRSSLLAQEVRRPGAGGQGAGISAGMRDGSAHVLRCLKVWYDLPSDVFHTALSNIDTFLAKMKVSTTFHELLYLMTSQECERFCGPIEFFLKSCSVRFLKEAFLPIKVQCFHSLVLQMFRNYNSVACKQWHARP